MFDPEFLNGIAVPHLVGMAKLWLHKNVCTPWQVLKAMDLAGGSLNYEGIEVLRKVESDGKRYCRG